MATRLVCGLSQDEVAEERIKGWIKQAGDKISLEEIQQKYREYFKCEGNFFYEREVVAAPGVLKLKFEDGMVSL